VKIAAAIDAGARHPDGQRRRPLRHSVTDTVFRTLIPL